MPSLSSILNDPNYVNANAETKQAIFDRWAPSDTNYTSANDATKQAIRQRFGLAVTPAEPVNPLSQIPGAGPSQAPASEVPVGRKQPFSVAGFASNAVQLARPTVEAVGATLGGIAGAPLGLVGGLGGAGLGYGIAKGGLDVIENLAGTRAPPKTATEAVISGAQDVGMGTAMQGIGTVAGSALGKGIEYAGKVGNIKLNAYLKALEGKGDDILALLRGKQSQVPGAAPTAGEVAAPAGSVRFSTLQAQAMKVPALTSEYALMAGQTSTAQAAHQQRVQSAFAKLAAEVEKRMNSIMRPVNAEDVGAALKAAADAEKTRVKAGVIEPAYEKAFSAAGDAKIGMENVVSRAEDILGRKLSTFDPSTAPETVRKLMSLQPPAPKALGAGKISGRISVQAPEPPASAVNLRELDDIRKAINADIASAKVSNDPAISTRLRNLYQLHDEIDAAVANAKTLTPEAKSLYSNALNLYRTEYVPRFKTGVNAELFQAASKNEPKIKPEDVVKKYFQPGGVSEANNFIGLFGNNPKALQVARTGIENLYLQEAKALTPEAHAAFLRKYADPIRVLENSGMNVLDRINAVGLNAARLAEINQIAAANKVNLPPPLPPGATADAVARRIASLTKGMSQKQLESVSAIEQDLLRSGEFERLVKAGVASGENIKSLGTETGREFGLPLSNFLLRAVTVFNTVYKRLALQMDNKIAMEIAREMTNPALAAKSIETALKYNFSKQLPSMAPQVTRTLTTGAGLNMLAPSNDTRNNLAP